MYAAAQSSPCRCHVFTYFVYASLLLVTVSHCLQLWQDHTTYSLEIQNIALESFIPPHNIPEELISTLVPAWITTQTKRRHRRRPERKQNRGKRAGIHVRLKNSLNKVPLPSLFVANTQSLDDKIDKLRLRLSSQKLNNCTSVFNETWLNANILNSAIELADWTVYWADRTAGSGLNEHSGMCIYVGNSWCTSTL